jgi:hypothetical protein
VSVNSEAAIRAERVKYGLLFTSAVLGTYYILKGARGDDTPDPTPEQEWPPGSDGEQFITWWIIVGALGGSLLAIGELPEQFATEFNSIRRMIP